MDWFPWYFLLYEQDTMHLNPYQDGCYRRLIDHYMKTRSPLPDNDHALARIVGDSHANWVANGVAMVRPFFTPQNGLLYLKRCDAILAEQDGKTKELSEHGKKGAAKRWGKRAENSQNDSHPIATPMGSAIAKERTGDIEDTNVSSPPTPKQKISYDDDFEDFWKGWMPYDMDKGSKAQAKKVYEKSRKEVTHEIIIGKRDQYLANCHRSQRRTTHASTWLNPTGNRGWDDEYPEQGVGNTASTELSANCGKSKDDKLRDRVHATARQIDDLLG